MEAHEGILVGVWELTGDLCLVHGSRNAVVDIQQSYSIHAHAGTDELTQSTIDIYLTRYRDTLTGQTAVYITRNDTKLSLECRPALTSDSNVFLAALMSFYPVLPPNRVILPWR